MLPRRDIDPIIGLHRVPHNDAASTSSADENASDNSSRGGLRERSHLRSLHRLRIQAAANTQHTYQKAGADCDGGGGQIVESHTNSQ